MAGLEKKSDLFSQNRLAGSPSNTAIVVGPSIRVLAQKQMPWMKRKLLFITTNKGN